MRDLACALILLLLSLPLTAAAQPVLPCTAMVVGDGRLAAWSAPTKRPAGSDFRQLDGAQLQPGQALRLTLLPQDEVKFTAQPARSGAAGSHAGLLRLTIAEPGIYRVALGTAAWIDLLDHGVAVTSSAHMRGAACSGIHKMVDFPLHPGSYVLQISANAEPETTLLVVRNP